MTRRARSISTAGTSAAPHADVLTALESYASDLKARYSVVATFQPEDQLKGPVIQLVESVGAALGLSVRVVSEVRDPEVAGRPDLGASVGGLVAGHVELKAPGKGADPRRLKGRDKDQWSRFQDLPNLVYTDGNAWALYRHGKRVGGQVRFGDDVIEGGADAVSERDAINLLGLLREFLRWEPVVPASPTALAELLAPICRLLRSEVLGALKDPDSSLSSLATDWRKYLFPDADDAQFADAYAQTLTYALLLARLTGAGEHLSVHEAVGAIRSGHRLLSDTLKILGDEAARDEIGMPVDLLERIIGAVDPEALVEHARQGDPWLYFYEDFLAAYDPKMRNDRGVYYTPVPVVRAQVRLVAQLLREHFGADDTFADPNVTTLDPAGGTLTYILTAIDHSLDHIAATRGPGMRANAATTAAENAFAFEILVGPYAVGHLRLTQQILEAGGSLPAEGVHVYLTDTLEAPHAPQPALPTMYRALGEEHRRAQLVKRGQRILVCLGNPPYDRQQIDAEDTDSVKRKGGWVRFGDEGVDEAGILRDFITPLVALNAGVHAKNLYNDYVYFWRWALWKVFESKDGPGIVSFITASSYLRGPGFAGMRQVMRQTFDDLWIIDLEGDSHGARKTENVFAIQTPVAIAVGVRYGSGEQATPAKVHYTRITGTRAQKYERLDAIGRFADLEWRLCEAGLTDEFLPISDRPYWDWPLLTDLFPWQENGMQFKRTWPIGESRDVLERRWRTLLELPATEKRRALRETDARRIDRSVTSLRDSGRILKPLAGLASTDEPDAVARYAYRSFDRQFAIIDNRLCDRPRPGIHNGHGDQQVYMTSLLTNVLGNGPAVVATALVPDLDHFRGSFGAKHVVPLFRNRAATEPNVTGGLLRRLTDALGQPVSAEDLFAYCYALLATPEYVHEFWEELRIPGPRIPITKDAALFGEAAALGRRFLWLHTFGERFVPEDAQPGRIPPGRPRCERGTPTDQERYPEEYHYDAEAEELSVGEGRFTHVRPEVWEFSVSGLQVVKSWLDYRMKHGAGRKSSPLDDIRPTSWQFDGELLDLLWVLDGTVDLLPEAGRLLHRVLAEPMFQAIELPEPSPGERKALSVASGQIPML